MRKSTTIEKRPNLISLKTGNEFQILNREDFFDFTGAVAGSDWNIVMKHGSEGFATIMKAYEWAQKNI